MIAWDLSVAQTRRPHCLHIEGAAGRLLAKAATKGFPGSCKKPELVRQAAFVYRITASGINLVTPVLM